MDDWQWMDKNGKWWQCMNDNEYDNEYVELLQKLILRNNEDGEAA